MLYLCSRPTRKSRSSRASSFVFSPLSGKKGGQKAKTIGHLEKTTYDLVFSKCFVVSPKCPIVENRKPAVARKLSRNCSRRLKTLKLRRLEGLISRSVRAGSKGAAARKADACTDRGPDRTTRRRRSTKSPQRVKTRHFDVKMRFPLYKEAVIHKFYLYLPRKKILLWPKLNYYPCSPGC